MQSRLTTSGRLAYLLVAMVRVSWLSVMQVEQEFSLEYGRSIRA